MTLNELVSFLESKGATKIELEGLEFPCSVYHVNKQLSPDSELKKTLEKMGYGIVVGTEDYFKDLVSMKLPKGEVLVPMEESGILVEGLGEEPIPLYPSPQPPQDLTKEDYARIMQKGKRILLIGEEETGPTTYAMVYHQQNVLMRITNTPAMQHNP